MVNPYFTGRIPGLPGVPLSESSYAAEGLSLPGVLRALQGTQTPALRTTATGLEAMPGVTYTQVHPDVGIPLLPAPPDSTTEKCLVRWNSYITIIVKEPFRVLDIGGVPNPKEGGGPQLGLRKYTIPWWVEGVRWIPKQQGCVTELVLPPRNISATLLNPRFGTKSAAKLKLIQAPWPPE